MKTKANSGTLLLVQTMAVRQTQTGTLLTNKQTKYKKTIARCSVLQTIESTKRNFLIRSIVYVYLDLDKHFLQIRVLENEKPWECEKGIALLAIYTAQM